RPPRARGIPAAIEGRQKRQGQGAAAKAQRSRSAQARRQSVAPVTPAPGLDPNSTLSVTALNKRYKSRIVVHDVSLSVGSGEVVGLLGPNGAGKTTCFYMIVGLVATDGGAIELDGDDLTRMPIHVRARLGLSYLPQ